MLTYICPYVCPPLLPPPPQVTLLASGRLMYHGLRESMVPWFATQGYSYDPTQHGVASDWALDLVAIGFDKPKRFYGHTITTMEQLQHASNVFVSSYTADPALCPYHGGPESMIGSRSISQKVQARMQQLVGVRRATEGAPHTGRSIGGASSCASYDASSTCSSVGGLQGDLKLMDSCKDVAVVGHDRVSDAASLTRPSMHGHALLFALSTSEGCGLPHA